MCHPTHRHSVKAVWLENLVFWSIIINYEQWTNCNMYLGTQCPELTSSSRRNCTTHQSHIKISLNQKINNKMIDPEIEGRPLQNNDQVMGCQYCCCCWNLSCCHDCCCWWNLSCCHYCCCCTAHTCCCFCPWTVPQTLVKNVPVM